MENVRHCTVQIGCYSWGLWGSDLSDHTIKYLKVFLSPLVIEFSEVKWNAVALVSQGSLYPFQSGVVICVCVDSWVIAYPLCRKVIQVLFWFVFCKLYCNNWTYFCLLVFLNDSNSVLFLEWRIKPSYYLLWLDWVVIESFRDWLNLAVWQQYFITWGNALRCEVSRIVGELFECFCVLHWRSWSVHSA